MCFAFTIWSCDRYFTYAYCIFIEIQMCATPQPAAGNQFHEFSCAMYGDRAFSGNNVFLNKAVSHSWPQFVQLIMKRQQKDTSNKFSLPIQFDVLL